MDRKAAAQRTNTATPLWSLSARRAWIEKLSIPHIEPPLLVALRKESVDRKLLAIRAALARPWSLSARRAWIEKNDADSSDATSAPVALRKESVDRKITRNIKVSQEQCRSPQGERG